MVGGDGRESGAWQVQDSRPEGAGRMLMTPTLPTRILPGGTADVGRGEVLDRGSACSWPSEMRLPFSPLSLPGLLWSPGSRFQVLSVTLKDEY